MSDASTNATDFSSKLTNHDAAAANEIERLREAIRRLADQDATLSVCSGNVTVTVDATLTDAEREAVEWCVEMAIRHATECDEEVAALRGLLERMK